MKKVVIALGGNALIRDKKKNSIKDQAKNIQKVSGNIINIAENNSVVITHGNGPQIGFMLIRVAESIKKAYPLPLNVCVAETQGEIGYLIQQSLYNALRKSKSKKNVVTLLTQVLVDKKDKAFRNPTKPVGPFLTKEKALALRKHGFNIIEDAGRGYRKVVPSPKLLKIVESEAIRQLLKNNIVIACGGGGIPVIEKNNKLQGIDAVIDKDLASASLAISIKADSLIILTDVEYVYLNYKKKNQKKLTKLTVKEAKKYMKEGHFASGSMEPKIQAAINFLSKGGRKVLITDINNVGKGGTLITK